MVLTRLGGQQTSLGILKLVFSVDNWPFLVNDSLAETIYFSFLKGWWVETRESERHFQRGATKTLQQDFGWNARGPQSFLRRGRLNQVRTWRPRYGSDIWTTTLRFCFSSHRKNCPCLIAHLFERTKACPVFGQIVIRTP